MHTTTQTTDAELLTALDASPDFVTVNGPGHLADMLGIDIPDVTTFAILGDKTLASGIERGIIAAGILERLVPDGVQIEEYNLGAKRTTRGVFLHQDGVDQIAMHFLDATAEVSVHIEADDPDQAFDRFITTDEMFELVRGYYKHLA